jgi:hypothetical protein
MLLSDQVIADDVQAKGVLPKILPVELPTAPSSAGITTLKNRTLGRIAELCVECPREVARPLMKIKI